MPTTYSETLLKCLKLVHDEYNKDNPKLTHTELEWLYHSVILSKKRGHGGGSPHYLDILCISALTDQRACLHPSWIGVRCHHGNVTFKVVRCRSCEGCRHSWRSRVRAMILEGSYGYQVYMWTLTFKQYPRQMKGDRFDYVQDRWHNMLRDMAKERVTLQYFCVVELQKRGTPHFHIAVKSIAVDGHVLTHTDSIASLLRSFSLKAGFGVQDEFQAARLGGAGVASYMSKYLTKSEGFNELRRKDGRAIRRYCRSRHWCKPQPQPVWRYSRIDDGFTYEEQNTQPVRCDCGEGQLLNRDQQARKWLRANRREGHWVAPLGVADYLLEKGS